MRNGTSALDNYCRNCWSARLGMAQVQHTLYFDVPQNISTKTLDDHSSSIRTLWENYLKFSASPQPSREHVNAPVCPSAQKTHFKKCLIQKMIFSWNSRTRHQQEQTRRYFGCKIHELNELDAVTARNAAGFSDIPRDCRVIARIYQ